MKNKKGFTLIELLAVIIILGILMIIAIPSVTRYINDSRKSAYVDTAKQVISAAKNLVNSGQLEMYDTNVTYYIPNSCIRVENGEKAKSPYGELIKAYVVVTYDGKGYNYYWTSVDDTGTGVKDIIIIDELDTNNVESDIALDDIHDDYGKEGKFNIKVLSDCTNFIDKEATNKPICIRAKVLNTAICERTDTNGCRKNNRFNTNDVITYGSLGTRGVLKTGDAFDCDVNGDGIYDKELERFYYISDYFDTNTLQFDSNYAVLINNKNYTNRTLNQLYEGWGYNGSDNWHGPAIGHLPEKSNWKNISLKESRRQILSCDEYKCNNISNSTAGGSLPIANYSSNSSRFLTLMELRKGCLSDNVTYASNYNTELAAGELDNCLFLFENTTFSSNNFRTSSIMIETPRSSNSTQVWIPQGNGRTLSLQSVSQFQKSAIRPVIEVKLSDIDY